MKIDIPTVKVEVKCGNQSSQDGLVNLDQKEKIPEGEPANEISCLGAKSIKMGTVTWDDGLASVKYLGWWRIYQSN